ncbi:MAG: GDP-mannose 4,6-dehydratase, partial [Anaerolineales bacterium]|nr:GDP-mannose 4,6-dehydratase [Anaerolineales bacterium]
NKPLTVYGDGSQTRSFQYYTDLVEGIYRLLFSAESLPVNIGNPSEMSILEFAKAVIEVSDSKSDIMHVNPKDDRFTDDPKLRQPDISKAKRVLDWEPKVGLQEGLKETVAYFRPRV